LSGRISEALLAFDREKTLQVAQKYIEKRKYDRAILEYQKVVEHEPTDARTLLRIGDLQARLGAHAEAIATYDRVALYYAGRGFSLKAVAVLKQISELIDRHAPQLADQYGHVAPKLAQIYADLGLTNDALATYDAVARRLQNRGRDRDAVEIIRRMLALERSNPLPYLRLAEALCRVSRVDEAVEHFWSASQLLTQQGRPDDALKVLERILHFRQDGRVARVAAELYLTKNTREAGLSALSRLQLCFEADPRDLDTLALLARAFDVIGQPAKGVEVYKEMVRIAGETGQRELHQRYVQHLLTVAPRDDQVRALARVYRLDPTQLDPRASNAPASISPHSSRPPESLTEDDLEFIEDEEEEVAPLPPVKPVPAAASQAGQARAPRRESQSVPQHSAPQAPEVPPAIADALRKALVDAEAFRALRMFAKAAATLKKALSAAPHSLELRAALQQVLLDMGDRAGAVDQMLSVAQHYLDRGSVSAAEAELYQVLELSPEHPAALALLDRIEEHAKARRKAPVRSSPKAAPGARSGDERSSPTGEHEAFELVAARVSTPAGAELNDGEIEPELESDDEPLPAYELEDDDLITVMPAVAPVPSPASPAGKAAAAPSPAGKAAAAPSLAGKSPAGKSPAGKSPAAQSPAPSVSKPSSDSPLPQFSLEPGADSGFDSGLHPAPAAPARGPAARGPERRSEPMASQPAPSQRESIRAALDEAQFFSARGLYQDASLILLDRLEQYPDDPDLKQAIDELEPKLNSESGTRDVGRLTDDSDARRAAPAAENGFDDEEDTVASSPLPDELAARIADAQGTHARNADARRGKGKELGVQFSTDGTTQAGPVIDADAELDLVQALDEPKQEQIDVDEVFAKFKQGVKAQVSDNDSATHYDLGVAYKEMGLVADAIREFEIASRDPKRECNCLAMMGMMHRDRGDLDRAAEAYVRGLSAQHKTVAQEVSLYYDLGIVYEMKNDADEAIYYFQRITRRDPTYRDVSQRLAALLPRSRRFSQPARAINDDQDFDRSFDDLYKPE
jgi:tetratricopeptide (TPR) repeat protein